MSHRRILSLWFPRLGAERLIRAEPILCERPFAVVESDGPAQVLSSLNRAASEAGLRKGQALRDAHAQCADLLTRPRVAHREAAFLGALHRWAGKFSPWVASEPPDALVIDLTGCTHLFGGEEPLCRQVMEDCGDLGLSVHLGIGDTLGTAWALARYAEQRETRHHRSGDAIDAEAPATRSRAGKRRHWERGGAAPIAAPVRSVTHRIAPTGKGYTALSALPVAALRLDTETLTQLNRLGLRRVGDLLGQPRAGLARRFGRGLVDRLDQATGSAPEPITPTPPPERFAVRLSFPDPIGLAEDVEAAWGRMMPRLCDRLETRGRGMRRLRLEAYRCDHSMQWLEVTAAVAHHDAARWLPLLKMKLEALEAGPGIDMMRIEAVAHEALHDRSRAGHAEAARRGQRRVSRGAAMEDLVGRLGARIGMDAITRRHPGESHIPEKTALTLAAAWSQPAPDWPEPRAPRPLTLWPPEAVNAGPDATPPERFRWRGRDFVTIGASGPERIAPEWWLDDPAWRSGPRDYWRVETDHGDRLWLFFAHGAAASPGWFCHGAFA